MSSKEGKVEQTLPNAKEGNMDPASFFFLPTLQVANNLSAIIL